MNVTIVAPCGPVNAERLKAGAERLQRLGFGVRVHPQCAVDGPYTAGPDALRVGALLEAARDDSCNVIWCARGGYGATRLLPLLETVPLRPGKTLVGYSDVTALHHFVAHRWGWRNIHGPMPAAKQDLPDEDWQRTADLVRGKAPPRQHVRWLTRPPAGPIEAPLVGGNLSIWNCLTGTPWQPEPRGRLLFFEEVHEAGYAIDRMLTQLRVAGGLHGVAGIVLGSFTDGPDEAELPGLFGDLGVPVAMGLPSGHGERCMPLQLGAAHRLTPDGWFQQIS